MPEEEGRRNAESGGHRKKGRERERKYEGDRWKTKVIERKRDRGKRR